jgi:type VI secretion system secreted protein VgrG
MSLTQTGRRFAVQTALGDDTLLLSSVHWEERLGRPFRGSVTMVSEEDQIDAAQLLGKPLAIRFDLEAEPSLHGIVFEFAREGRESGLTCYRAEVVPWFAMLQLSGGSRIFQDQSVVEIFKALAEQHGYSDQIDDRLTGDYEARTYCVQYQESDFQFLSRLLEEEGIYYFFEYSGSAHQLVLADDPTAHHDAGDGQAISYTEEDNQARPAAMFDWRSTRRVTTSGFLLNDYDFQKPRAEMSVRQADADAVVESTWYRYPGRYLETTRGESLARVRCEAAAGGHQQYSLATNLTGVRGGAKFTLADHPSEDLNQEYVVTGAALEATASLVQPGYQQADTFRCRLQLQASGTAFRTPLETPRPRAMGPHLATVVGSGDEEIWTDAYGRIKVQFAWDLEGAGDDSSSCWVRVAQPWTGKGYGAVSVPRVGEEVVVQFVDGDVDRPIVMGRLHNADRMPPETLPDNQAKTILRTRSTKGGDVDAFHELTFDDTKDSESIYFHSERDFNRVVENNDTLKVGFDKQDAGDQTIQIYNNQQLEIGLGSGSGSQTIQIAQDRSVEVQQGDDKLSVQQGDQAVEVATGSISQTAGNSITLEADQTITLKCGASQIELSPSGIKLSASQISLQGEGQVQIEAAEISAAADGQLKLNANMQASLQGSGQLTLKAPMVMIN